MHSYISRGWPYADCAIHVQVRQKNKEMDLHEVRRECEEFGHVLKIYPWTSKKSSTPQAYVLFDSPGAVHIATQSLLHGTSRLWKTGYHMLKMCESTSEMIQTFFKKDGITRDDPMFANIPVIEKPWSKPWAPKKPPPVRGEQEPEHAPPIAPGSRYRPYSLNGRPDASTSAQASHVTKQEPTSPKSPSKLSARQRAAPGSPTSAKFVPNKTWSMSRDTSLSRSVAPPPNPVLPNPTVPTPTLLSPSPPPSNVDDVDQRQLNMKLQSDIYKLVSDHIDTVQEVRALETENALLETKLQTAEQELARLRSSHRESEEREQALIARLDAAELERDGAQDACTQALAAIKDLLANQKNAEAAQAELLTLWAQFETVKAQLATAEARLRFNAAASQARTKHTAEVGVQSEPPRTGSEDASSVDTCDPTVTPTSAPAPAPAPFAIPVKPGLLSDLMDAFNDIDSLVRNAFSKE